MSGLVGFCDVCVHARKSGGCDAFPGGIPQVILDHAHDHRLPYPGDQGIRFEVDPQQRIVADMLLPRMAELGVAGKVAPEAEAVQPGPDTAS